MSAPGNGGDRGVGGGAAPKRATAWISHGFEELAADPKKLKTLFDVVIVGSGYGGAVAAAELAGCRDKKSGQPLTVCVLERGSEYLEGMFPSRLADLAGHVRFNTSARAKPRGMREGLFDIRVGPDVSALVANGLGGGSLINAGVMERPSDEVFASWPESVRRDLTVKEKEKDYFQRAKELLGATDQGKDNTVARHHKKEPEKYRALKRLGESMKQAPSPGLRLAPITVAMRDKQNAFGVPLKECTFCGDCATGCNHGAKESLDLNLLVQARRRGAGIYTGATVLRIAREDDQWTLAVVHTDENIRKRQGEAMSIRARKLILAAGSFGSTEILLRSRSETLRFSRLGQRFSTNGDMIAVNYKQDTKVHAVADERVPACERGIGPTITGVLDLRKGPVPVVVEELAIPGPLRRAFEEVVTTTNALHELAVPDCSMHGMPLRHDPCAVDGNAMDRSLPLAVMGDDGANGLLELVEGETGKDERERGDGAIRVRWPSIGELELFRKQIKALRERAGLFATDARVLPHPLWQLVPDKMQFLMDDMHGALFTVHPLGGCPMGKDVDAGTVDHLGRVYDPTTRQPHPGLVVLDGSIVPGALGINPALTIAALALRAVETLRDDWGFEGSADGEMELEPRPVFRKVSSTEGEQPPRPTDIQLAERLSGRVSLVAKEGGEPVDYVVEQTLTFNAASVAALMLPGKDGNVPIQRRMDVEEGALRMFRAAAWDEWHRDGEPEVWTDSGGEKRVDDIVEATATISGCLNLLHRERSNPVGRRWRALLAWLPNRGLRDIWQWIFDKPSSGTSRSVFGMITEGWERFLHALALASHAGEVRLLKYELKVTSATSAGRDNAIDWAKVRPESKIHGVKRLTYGRRSNPWRQLMEMTLTKFPIELAPGQKRVLKLDPTYLVKQRVPLVRIVGQQDQVAALIDLASIAAYFARLLLTIHVWSFRKPDAPDARYDPRRLPGTVEGLPEPQIIQIRMPRTRLIKKRPSVRLARYNPGATTLPPVVLIHGYSASGTTFAHHAVRPNLAEHLCNKGRDVWILDLRTSSGMPTASDPWRFEDAALNDLPAAFARVHRETGMGQIDVFAHCMGAAMFTMAVLAPPEHGEPYFAERDSLPKWIRKAVLSQIGPTVVMSPANLFRGYAMSYLRYFLPLADYQFRVTGRPGVMDQLIDRLLATLPYPEEEFDVENPVWPWRRTPFVGTRHRMDALYGRDFNLADENGRPLLDNKVLEYIDDLFGPLSIDTVSQAIHFARTNMITNYEGRNKYVLRKNLQERWRFPTMSIHGEKNGLADIATLERLKNLFDQLEGVEFIAMPFPPGAALPGDEPLPGFGHQDCLIGKKANLVFEAVSKFLG